LFVLLADSPLQLLYLVLLFEDETSTEVQLESFGALLDLNIRLAEVSQQDDQHLVVLYNLAVGIRHLRLQLSHKCFKFVRVGQYLREFLLGFLGVVGAH
jgi:hypothetical protein